MTNRDCKILLVGPLPPPAGGMANQARQLKRLLEVEGFVVAVARTNAPYRPASVASIRILREAFRLVPYVIDLLRKTREATVVHVMANSGLAWYLCAAPAIAIGKWYGKPVVVNYRGGLAAEFLRNSASRVRRALRGTRMVVPSAYLKSVFAQHGMECAIVPNVVDGAVFHPTASGSRRTHAFPHVVIARNLEHIYGIDLGLRCIAILRRRYPELKASVAGSGPELPALIALAADLQLTEHVRFTGSLEVPDMVALYQSADIVLNPVRVDNTPNSVLEALACGIPVVSTDVGGIPYLVQHERSALLAEPESAEALAAQATRILQDESLRMSLVARGLELTRECAWPSVRDRWLNVYGVARA